MKAFFFSVSLAIICTTSAVATAMRFMDNLQDDFSARTRQAVYHKAGNAPATQPFTLAAFR